MESDGKCKDAKEGCKNSEQRIEKNGWMLLENITKKLR